MFSRAVIVLLLVLNLGVALWWWTRDPAPIPPASSTSTSTTASVVQASAASLEWLPAEVLAASAADGKQPSVKTPDADSGDVPSVDAFPAASDDATATPDVPASADANPVAVARAAEPSPPRCHALGPFSDRSTADAALAQLRPQVMRSALRAVEGRPDRWRVLTPVLTGNTAARALAERLTAAGFSDHYVMPAVDTATGSRVALGRFSSEQAAQRHQGALRAAGFADVLVEAEGDLVPRYWIDVMVAADTDPATLRLAVRATRANAVDCAFSR